MLKSFCSFLAFSLAFFVILSRTEFFKYYLDEQETKMSDLNEKATDEDTKEKFLDSENCAKNNDVKINPLRILGKISLYGASVFLRSSSCKLAMATPNITG